MPKATLYHNPRCSKSRAALALLEERGVELELVEYLTHPLDANGLAALQTALGLPPGQWIRTREATFAEAGLAKDSPDATLLAAIAQHPILMERPIFVCGNRAVVGRPPERVLELL